MSFAILMTKLFREEEFDSDDWNETIHLIAFSLNWLYEKSSEVKFQSEQTSSTNLKKKPSSQKKTKKKE